MTGDTIGALSESAEVLVLLFAFLIKWPYGTPSTK
jgi:cobalamin synthase